MNLLDLHFQGFNTHCPYGKSSFKFCLEQQCIHKPLMCNQRECQCQNDHIDCHKFVDLIYLGRYLHRKSLMKRPVLQQLFQWCSKSIKQITILESQIKYQLDQTFKHLQGDQLKIFISLKEGDLENITKQLILDVMNSIQNNKQREQTQKRIDQVKIDNEKLISNIRTLTERVKVLFKQQIQQIKQIPKLKISQNLHHPNIKINGTIMKLDSVNDNGLCGKLALFEPSLESRQKTIQKFRFKIIRSFSGFIGFGLCHKETIQKSNFTTQKTSYGSGYYRVLATNGQAFSHYFKKQDIVQTAIKSILVGQIVELSFNAETLKMTITNVTQNQSAILSLNKQQGNPLHVAIRFSQKNDTVEYLGQVLE